MTAASNNHHQNKGASDSQGAATFSRNQTPPTTMAPPVDMGAAVAGNTTSNRLNIPPPPLLPSPPTRPLPPPETATEVNGSHGTAAAGNGSGDGGLSMTTSANNSHYKSGIVREGWVLKRASRLSAHRVWNVRYFVLRSDDRTLSYYVRRSDMKPKNSLPLVASDCEVGDIYVDERRRATPDGGNGANAEDEVAAAAAEHPHHTEAAGLDELPNDSFHQPSSSSASRGKKTRETLYCFKISWGSAKVLGKTDSSNNVTAPSSSSPERGGSFDADTVASSVPSAEATAATAASALKKSETRAAPASAGPSNAANSLDALGEGGAEQVIVTASSASSNRVKITPLSTSNRTHHNSSSGSTSQREEQHVSDETSTTASSGGGGSGGIQSPRSPRRKAASASTSPFSYPDADWHSEISTASTSAPPPNPPSPAAASPGSAASSATRTPRRTRRVSAPAAATAPPRSTSVPPPLPTIEDMEQVTRRTSPKKQAKDPMSASYHQNPTEKLVAPTHKRSSSGAAAFAKEALANMRDSSRSVTTSASSKTAAATTNTAKDAKQAKGPSHSKSGSSADVEADLLSLRRSDSVEEEEEHLQNLYKAAKRANQKRTKRRIVQGSKIAVATGAVVTAGILSFGVGLAAGAAFLGAAAAAGGSGAVAEASYKWSRREGVVIVIALSSLEEAKAWKAAIEAVINSDQATSNIWAALYEQEGRSLASLLVPTPSDAHVSRITRGGGTASGAGGGATSQAVRSLASAGDASVLTNTSGAATVTTSTTKRDLTKSSELQINPTARWKPLDGGWATLLGIGAHGLRIFREEERDEDSSDSPVVPLLFRSRVKALVQQATRRRSLSVEGGRPCPLLRAELILSSSPLTAFMCLMSNGRIQNEGDSNSFHPNSGQRASFRVIETLDEHMDVIHVIFRPLYLFPSWTTPRDFVLFRYWRLDINGAYVICYDSVAHRECPPMPGCVRGELHGVYTIAPRKRVTSGGSGGAASSSSSSSAASTWAAASECLLTQWVQVDPRGWVPTFPLPPLANQGYAEAFSVAALLQMLDVKDALDHDRFVSVTMGRPMSASSSLLTPSASAGSKLRKAVEESKRELIDDDDEEADYEYVYPNAAEISKEQQQLQEQAQSAKASLRGRGVMSSSESSSSNDSSGGKGTGVATMENLPPPLPLEMWDNVDADTFRVRGKTYKKDKVKINAGQAVLRLLAVDILESDASIYGGVCLHPDERVQRALARERRDPGGAKHMPAFVMAVNIVLPGPPFYHVMFYFGTDDLSLIDGSDGTEFSQLAKDFLFGSDDAFRDATFKLIPRIVQGNFVVRKAVGSTPAIMGTKLRQTYARGQRFLEVILDCGSSAVAAGVIRLCLGYAKTIAVDMAFVLEGKEEQHLPERVLGCVRLSHVEFGKRQVRYVPSVVT